MFFSQALMKKTHTHKNEASFMVGALQCSQWWYQPLLGLGQSQEQLRLC